MTIPVVTPGAPAPITDDELHARFSRLLSLIEGIEVATHSCACGRYYRLGMSAELQSLLPELRRALLQRSADVLPPDSSRFAWLEVD